MTKNNNEFEKDNNELDKWDVRIANTFIIVLAIGLFIAGIVMLKMAY